MSRDVRGDLVLKLKEIFRSDRSDLDFGIYRILKHRRDEINRYIEEDLVRKAEEEFGSLTIEDLEAAEAELSIFREEINRDFGAGTINEKGEVTRNHEAPKIKQYLDKKQKLSDGEWIQTQINDVFNHVYEFFNRYYDKGDFISQRRFGGREKFVIPYNGEEVSLYWVNQDQYYVKTSEDYYKYTFKIGEYSLVFRLVTADVIQNNNVKEDSFFQIHREIPLRFVKDQNKIEIFFEHRTLMEEDLVFYNLSKRSHKTTKTSTIIEKNYEIMIENLKKIGSVVDPIVKSKKLKENLVQYSSKNDMDYFIHKNLDDFLRREFEFYIKNEIMDMDEWLSHDEKNIRYLKNKIRAIRSLTEDIINFLAEIERYQLHLFEKKKLVLKTGYCISLDRIPEEFYEEIGNNREQIADWKKIYKLAESTEGTLFSIGKRDTLNVEDLKNHQNLMLDTKFFTREFTYRLLSCFSDLYKSIEGICIKSDNWHGLNLIGNTYNKKIKTIYLDPPYNTGNDGFLYKDKYQHSSWLTMMYDRLKISMHFLTNDGVLFINIDDIEVANLKLLMNYIISKNYSLPTLIWKKKGTSTNVKGVMLSSQTDYILVYGYSNCIFPRIKSKTERKYPNLDEIGHFRTTIIEKKDAGDYARETMKFKILGEIPRDGKRWQIGEIKARLLEKNNRFIKEDGIIKLKIYDFEDKDTLSANPNLLTNVGSTQSASSFLADVFGEAEIFNNPKPIELIKHLISISTLDDSIIMDYYAGSGTTAISTLILNKEISLNNKYIIMEMGEYFDNILLKFIKKMCYSLKWRNGIPNTNSCISHFFKYIHLEQYEDTLQNILFTSRDRYAQTKLPISSGAFINYILKKEAQGSPVLLNIDMFKTPFEYKIKTLQYKEEKEENVDLVETFNYLLGIKVKKIRQYNNEDTQYIIVYGEKEETNENILIIWRNFDDSKLEAEKHFIEEIVIPELHPDNTQPLTIYINVDSYVKGAQSIEPKFKEFMGIRND